MTRISKGKEQAFLFRQGLGPAFVVVWNSLTAGIYSINCKTNYVIKSKRDKSEFIALSN